MEITLLIQKQLLKSYFKDRGFRHSTAAPINKTPMSLQKFIANYSTFNEWANHKIIHWLQKLDIETLYKTTFSSYPSLDYTMQHILRGQRFWLKFISQEDVSDFKWTVREGEAAEILNELKANSTEMKHVFSSFSEAELIQNLSFDMPWAKNNCSRYDYIVHIINHSSFHRGQIITIARSIGITEGIVNTDYNMFNCL